MATPKNVHEWWKKYRDDLVRLNENAEDDRFDILGVDLGEAEKKATTYYISNPRRADGQNSYEALVKEYLEGNWRDFIAGEINKARTKKFEVRGDIPRNELEKPGKVEILDDKMNYLRYVKEEFFGQEIGSDRVIRPIPLDTVRIEAGTPVTIDKITIEAAPLSKAVNKLKAPQDWRMGYLQELE